MSTKAELEADLQAAREANSPSVVAALEKALTEAPAEAAETVETPQESEDD